MAYIFLFAYARQHWNSLSLDLVMGQQTFMTVRQKVMSKFSIDRFSAPYCPILINFSLVNLCLCFFKYTKFGDDWLKLTPPFVI